MSSFPTEPERSFDYTDGASVAEIQDALAERASRPRARRESQIGSGYGRRHSRSMSGFRDDDEVADGAVFDGPGSVNFPSSISKMRHEGLRAQRRSFESRRAMDGDAEGGEFRASVSRRSSMQSLSVGEPEVGPEITHKRSFARRSLAGSDRSVRNRSPDDTNQERQTIFGNIAKLFGRRDSRSRSPTSRRSRSRQGSVAGDLVGSPIEGEDEDDRWGYLSGEEDIEEDEAAPLRQPEYMSSRESSPSPTGPLPGMLRDPIFGDTRIDLGEATLLDDRPPPPGPPSRQNVYIADEDIELRFLGYEMQESREWVWTIMTISSVGLLGLLGQWFPKIWLNWVARERGFKLCSRGIIVVETPFGDHHICKVKTVPYPYPYASTFTDDSPLPSTVPSSAGNTRPPSTFKMSTTANGTLHPNGSHASFPLNDTLLGVLKYFDYRYNRYALNPRTGTWVMVRDWRDKSWANVVEVSKGLDDNLRQQRLTLFGPNLIEIIAKSTVNLLVDEVIHPFYVFQIASIILWSIDDYYYYAFCIAIISAFSIISTLIETRKTMARMREMSRFSCDVGVKTKNGWAIRDSSTLVPGDVINLSSPSLSIFPADILLLSGDAIVNESMLTGESVPVSKVAISNSDLIRWGEGKEATAETAKGQLYTGTKVVRVRGNAIGGMESPATGLVVRTAFHTTKGALVRSMLFPKPMGFKFYRDSMRFIAVLAGIAGLGFLISAFQFVRLGVPFETITLRALDLITVVVPPALPATLSIGTSFAIGRLRKAGIFCISPNRVNVAGKVNVICFDKTGTLTEDGLDILGARALERDGRRFREIAEDMRDIPASLEKANLLHAMATCHSLKVVAGEIIGDPLDAKMFEFTGWTLEESAITVPLKKGSSSEGTQQQQATPLVQNIVRPPGTREFRLEDALKGGKRAHFLELGVIRTFDFVSALRRMTVITKRLKSKSMEIYLKGAPEILKDVCDPESFPEDYEDLLSYYTKNGYRVIGIAGKSVEGLSWLKAQRMKREQVESGLQFLGLIIFENKLKPGTAPAIAVLREAHLGCRMVTGDNPRTAVSVARECKLINSTAFVFYPVFVEGDASTPRAKLQWNGVDDESLRLDPYSLRPLPPPPHIVEDEERIYRDYALVLPGDVFRWMVNHASLETLQQMLLKAQIFARMSPDEKHELVERLQSIGFTVAFCGDGANDCGALKAADVGISLSEAEASVAAPFTSNTPDISCVLQVIKEGRAALVTSFSCFKYMALYSLIQFTTITFLYSFASSLGDFQFLYIDLFIIIPIAITMGRTLPYDKIHPQRPTASLVSRKVLSSIVGQIAITSAVQAWAFLWVRRQPWYTPPDTSQTPAEGKLESHNYENTILFLVSSFQYILVAAVFSIGPPYRQRMFTNGLLIGSIVLLSGFSTWVLLGPPQPVTLVLDLMPVPWRARLMAGVAVLVNVGVSFAYEEWIGARVAKAAGVIMHGESGRRRRRRESGRTYEAL